MDWRFRAADARQALSERHAFSCALRDSCTIESDFDAAELVFGELVANVVRHAPGPIDISVRSDNVGNVILEVRDHGQGFSLSPALPDPASESGRGLYIVSQVGSLLKCSGLSKEHVVSVVLPVRCPPPAE